MSQAPSDPGTGGPRRPVDLDAKLESEIEAALGDMSFEDMLDMTEPARAPSTGRELRTGTVVNVHGDDVFVEFGPKSQGVCPLMQFKSRPEAGERLQFFVDRYDPGDGLLILSREGAVQKASWDALEVGQIVEGRCVGMIKGGLEVMVADHKGFMPASQVDCHFVKDISVFLNEKVTCEIMELDRRRGRLVLSRRRVVEVEQERRRREVLETLQVGRRLPAVVTSIQAYGAFADIGGLDGLIHISDLSYERLKHPSEVLKEGDHIEVQVLRIDREQTPPRISLGMKQCLADPFTQKAGELTQGQVVSGRITRIMPFGAFVEIAPAVEGLIHISELSHERVSRVNSVVQPEQVVTCKVLHVDPASRRISLSLKALQDTPAAGGGNADMKLSRAEDPHLRKLKAQLSKKLSSGLKGGIG